MTLKKLLRSLIGRCNPKKRRRQPSSPPLVGPATLYGHRAGAFGDQAQRASGDDQ